MKFFTKSKSVCCVAALLTFAGAGSALADVESFADVQMGTEYSAEIGYRAFSVHGEPGRAAEYESLQSSPLLKGRVFTNQGGYHLELGVNYVNDEEFAAEGHLDTRGLILLDLRKERFVHNLDHIPYANGPSQATGTGAPILPDGGMVEGARPDARTSQVILYSDKRPGDDYRLRLDVDEVKLKVKCPDYPAHFSLAYWRYEKEGKKQLRFLDHGNRANGSSSGSCNNCHMQSQTRDIDRVTEEVKATIDAHAGFLDIVLEGLLRTFRDHEPVPTAVFGGRSSSATGELPAGTYAFGEDPDSKLKEMTLKLNTAPAGGLVGSASFTIGKRENQSDLVTDGPVEAETDYIKTSADVTYTPNQNWTVSMRYRLLDMDSDNTDVMTTVRGLSGANVVVPEALDIERAWYEGILSYRPYRNLTLKAEVRREDIHRDHAEPWDLPEDETVTRVRLGFTSRHLEKSALKFNGWMALQRSDDPAYGTTPEESKELFLTATYSPTGSWGLATTVNLLHDTGNDFELTALNNTVYDNLEREREQQNFSLSSWGALAKGVTADLSYGYLRTEISQDLLFGSGGGAFTARDNGVDYNQTVQTVNLGVTWQALESLVCRAEGYHIRSKASYSPGFVVAGGAGGSSADLHDISKVDIAQNGLKGRVDWKISENLTCGVEATFDDYDEKGNDVFDGSVQSYMASLTYTF